MNALPMPSAQIEVSLELVHRLLAQQMPDLADRPLRMLAHGWDNVMVKVGEEFVARLPRRAVAADLLAHEQRWLPSLAPRLPLPIPVPVRIGRPGPGYPWPWTVVRHLPGEIAARTPPVHHEQAAVTLATSLAALHGPAPADAPRNPVRGIPLPHRAARLAHDLDLIDSAIDRRAITPIWHSAIETSAWDQAPVWLHGDLHPANILVDRGQISAVIDFGDLTAGDPATDLSIAWMMLPSTHHETFRNAYHAATARPAEDDLWRRARGWALALAVAFLSHSSDNFLIADIGQRTLNAVVGAADPP